MKLHDFHTGKASHEGAWFFPKAPSTGEPFLDENGVPEIGIKFLGPESEPFQRYSMEIGDLTEVQARQARNIQLLTDLSVDSFGVTDAAGDNVDLSDPVEAHRFWSDRGYPWLFNQAIAFVGDRGNFYASTATLSLPTSPVASNSTKSKPTAERSANT